MRETEVVERRRGHSVGRKTPFPSLVSLGHISRRGFYRNTHWGEITGYTWRFRTWEFDPRNRGEEDRHKFHLFYIPDSFLVPPPTLRPFFVVNFPFRIPFPGDFPTLPPQSDLLPESSVPFMRYLFYQLQFLSLSYSFVLSSIDLNRCPTISTTPLSFTWLENCILPVLFVLERLDYSTIVVSILTFFSFIKKD